VALIPLRHSHDSLLVRATIFGAAPFSFLVFFTIPVYRWLANIMDAAQARVDAEASLRNDDVEGEE
jgi:hypothetical protein